MAITFRPATDADLPAIVALLADDALGRTREDTAQPVHEGYRAAFDAMQNDPNQLMAVADADGAVVGCLQLTLIPGLSRKGMWRGQIESVRIAASQRGSGLGHRMFHWAIDECRRRGCGLVQLTSDKSRSDALRFYDSLGFRATHEGLKLEL